MQNSDKKTAEPKPKQRGKRRKPGNANRPKNAGAAYSAESRTGTGTYEKPAGRKNLKERWQRKGQNKKQHSQREGKGRRIGRACTAARRDAGWLLSAAFFISDLTGMASLAKSGTGENGAEHSINRGCGKAQREMDGLPGWGIMGAKVRLRCFGGKGTGQTADRYSLERKIYKGACFKMRCAFLRRE